MKVKFIQYYFLMKIKDVPLATEIRTGHTPTLGKNYMLLRGNRMFSMLVYTTDLINIPTQGIGGQLIT